MTTNDWEILQEYLRNHLDVLRSHYAGDGDGEIVSMTDSSVVIADGGGEELYELAQETDVDSRWIRDRMLDEARRRVDYDWEVYDPVVIEIEE